VIYQVLKGGNTHIRTIITNPVGNITFARANSPFGWYDEESSTTPGEEIVYKEYFLLVFI